MESSQVCLCWEGESIFLEVWKLKNLRVYRQNRFFFVLLVVKFLALDAQVKFQN
jgi:hypothetical protein